jgi:hypothetical protein
MWYIMDLVGNFETEIDEGNTEMRRITKLADCRNKQKHKGEENS